MRRSMSEKIPKNPNPQKPVKGFDISLRSGCCTIQQEVMEIGKP